MQTVEKTKTRKLRRKPKVEKTIEEWARELLEDASDALSGHWVRGSWKKKENRCAVGWMQYQFKTNKKYPRRGVLATAKRMLAQAITGYDYSDRPLEQAVMEIISFNDDEGRSEQEVVRKFKEASAK